MKTIKLSKNAAKIISILVIFPVLFLFFGACTENNWKSYKSDFYSYDEILDWAEDNIPFPTTVSQQYTDVDRSSNTIQHTYTDRIWTAQLNNNPQISFTINDTELPDFLDSTSGTNRNIESTFNYVYGRYLYEQYQSEKKSVFTYTKSEPLPTSPFLLCGTYNDQQELQTLIDEAKSFVTYMMNSEPHIEINYIFNCSSSVGSDDYVVTIYTFANTDEVDTAQEELLRLLKDKRE